MQETIAEVLINRPSKHLNRTFSYRIPETMKGAGVGWRCVVNFARRKEEGIILSVHEEDTSSYPINFWTSCPWSIPSPGLLKK